jgi:serine/threonine-protein kinase
MTEVLPGTLELDEIRFHPDGRHLLLRTEGSSVGTRKLYVFERGVDSIPRLLVDSRFDHYSMDISRDGKWITYVSEESGRPEVYVRPFPDADRARYAISVGGGTEALWSRSGDELFYRTTRGELVSVPVTTGENFAHGVPKVLFALPELTIANYHRTYDVSRDGSRFLMVRSSGSVSNRIDVIFNWHHELDRLGKTAK